VVITSHAGYSVQSVANVDSATGAVSPSAMRNLRAFLSTRLIAVDVVRFGAEAHRRHPGGVALPHRMDDADTRAAVQTDGGHIAPDHAVRALDELRFDLGERLRSASTSPIGISRTSR